MNNVKRKRLAKACDACHKSKRRCDGTARCSNCFFASRECTYTDASGRPVPAPKASEGLVLFPKDEHGSVHDNLEGMDTSNIYQPESSSSQASRMASSSVKGFKAGPDASNPVPERGSAQLESGTLPAWLEPNLVRELVGLFFAHCQPYRMVIHMPSFTVGFSRNQVPLRLILAVCALGAPFSKSPRVRTTPPRMAGTRFSQAALELMFDSSGKLMCEADLPTIQALCLLECHDILTYFTWTERFRYFDLAKRIICETLDVDHADAPAHSVIPIPARFDILTERECIRRCFWLMFIFDKLSTSTTRLASQFPPEEISIRLPMDEASFEFGIHTAAPDYLNKPVAQTSNSELAHVIRIVTFFENMENCFLLEDEARIEEGLWELDMLLAAWRASLPNNLRFTEDNLQFHQSMFDTSSNLGAWCFYFIHSMDACFMVSVRKKNDRTYDPDFPEYERAKDVITRIQASVGNRATCVLVASVLWALSRYCIGDPDMHALDTQFDRSWGYKCLQISDTWREHNNVVVRKLEHRRGQRLSIPRLRELSLPAMDRGWIADVAGRNDRHRKGEDDNERRVVNFRNKGESLPSLKAVGLLEFDGWPSSSSSSTGPSVGRSWAR